MKLLRVLVTSAIVAISGAAMAQTKEWKEIRIGTEGAYPPYNNLNAKKELEGFEIDYMNDLCAKMKVKCTWVVQDWDGIIPALLSNKYDVIVAGMNATPERQKRVDFTSVYTSTPIAMVGAKSITSTDISPNALKGKNIGAQGSTIHMNYLEAYYKGSTARPYPTQEEANLDLLNGRLDYIVADLEALETFVKGKGKDCCKIIAEVKRDAAIHGPGVGMAMRKGEKELAAMLNKAIADSKADGSLDKHAMKWLGKKAIQ
ncbi:transporter substrate-binding domain-containing protein [Rhabdaerophilum sp. SD176]|uniref:transporter substrate-binding domain-containing protein n=1 Tax=Rhabdaerophilum sp. SD176 TaxID=2983548 RepID=UPI0024DF97D6|nr:transporter substrate-binding domain-containing protein [Rhabdaerophilum sp. SD176]